MTHILEKANEVRKVTTRILIGPTVHMFSSFNLETQPNGGLTENCLTTFIPDNGTSPKWFDRPCEECCDSIGEPGHKFMCECTAPYLHDPDQEQNPQGNNFVQICLQFYKY